MTNYNIIIDDTFVQAISCYSGQADESQCNPYGNCTYDILLSGVSEIYPLCKVCAEGTTGRLCSKCICEETGSSCMFRNSNNRCVTCESTDINVAIVTTVASFLLLCLILVIVISCRFPKAFKRLKAIFSRIANAGALKVKKKWCLCVYFYVSHIFLCVCVCRCF